MGPLLLRYTVCTNFVICTQACGFWANKVDLWLVAKVRRQSEEKVRRNE